MLRQSVFLIDDHDIILTMLRQLMHDMVVDVAGDARSGLEAIPKILETNPYLVIVDLSMPQQNGFDIVEELRGRGADCRFLAFTGTMGTHAIERLHQMRFDGIVSKLSRITELAEGVKAVLAGRSYCCPLFKAARAKHLHNPSCPANFLTKREVEVLALIGEAKSDREIALNLDIAPSTVQGVRGTLMYKLGLASTSHLVCFAREKGYTEFAARRSVQPSL
jgi:DNA-binding NarL/FixJ family response regulator